jgi:hypothetical protein
MTLRTTSSSTTPGVQEKPPTIGRPTPFSRANTRFAFIRSRYSGAFPKQEPPTLLEAPVSRNAYALCFSSAENAAEGPSEDEPEPSAVDLATSAVAN